MKIYIDLLFLINLWIDFFILLLTKLVLRRVASIKRLILASIFGAFTTFLVFFNLNYLLLTFLKIIMSYTICIIAFGYKNILFTSKNVIYLFMLGVVFGGLALFLKEQVSNKLIYMFSFLIVTPIMVILFYNQNKKIKKQLNLYYKVIVKIGSITKSLSGFLDSGNNLYDPVTKKPIILICQKKMKGINKIRSPMYVPIKTVNHHGLVKCYKPDNLLINNVSHSKYLIGLIDNDNLMDGADCLLNNRLLEDL